MSPTTEDTTGKGVTTIGEEVVLMIDSTSMSLKTSEVFLDDVGDDFGPDPENEGEHIVSFVNFCTILSLFTSTSLLLLAIV